MVDFDIWNQVEKLQMFCRMRNVWIWCRDYGLIYYYRTGENERRDNK